MIVVVGTFGKGGTRTRAGAIAAHAAHAGAHVEAVGVVPEGAAGDRLALELSRAGVGHAALLRAARSALEPADVDLALRYLTDVKVVVVTDLDEVAVQSAVDGSAWAGSRLVVIDEAGGLDRRVARLPDDAIVLEPPAADPDEAFAGFVAELAVRLDGGADPRAAWESALAAAQAEGVRLPAR